MTALAGRIARMRILQRNLPSDLRHDSARHRPFGHLRQTRLGGLDLRPDDTYFIPARLSTYRGGRQTHENAAPLQAGDGAAVSLATQRIEDNVAIPRLS